MLKLIKWNLLDYFKKNAWIPIGLVISFAIVFVPHKNFGLFYEYLNGFASVAGISLFAAGFLSVLLFAFRWIEKPSADLELSLPFSSYQLIAAKLIASVLVNTILLVFLWFAARSVAGILGWIVFLTFLESNILFAAILAHSYRWMRRAADLFTALLSLVLISAIITGTVLVMALSGQLIAPTFSTDSILTIEGNLQILSPALPGWIFLICILVEWWISSRLLQIRFQTA
ncbi:MAG: hypothetical protein PWQ55_2053 [Chloroflexota bacterium]|nr:hypothetical protein [Chloroflexota bacterium]